MHNKVFDSAKFLESFEKEPYKIFWEKVIGTFAFEYFILSDSYLDDSYAKIFSNITKKVNGGI